MDTPLNVYDEEYHTPVIVACRDGNGIPTFVPVVVSADTEDIEEGEHYAMAEHQAFAEGYEVHRDAICMDYQDAVQAQQQSVFLQIFEQSYEALIDPANPPEGYQPKDEWDPVIVALYRNEEAHGEAHLPNLIQRLEEGEPVEDLVEDEFVTWSLDNAIDMGLPIDPDSGAEMELYGYYNTRTHNVKWL